MPQAINIARLNATLGAYAQENNEQIMTAIMVENNLVRDFNFIEDVVDRIPLPLLETSQLLQPGRKGTWDPINDAVELSARLLQTRPIKIDLEIKPQELYASYLGTIRQKRLTDPTYELLFEEFIMNSIIAQAQKDIALEIGWRGVYNPTGTLPKDCLDGMIQIIRAAQVAGDLPSSNIAITGTINNTNAVGEFEKVFSKLPGYMMGQNMYCYCSYELMRDYLEDYRSSYGSLPYNGDFVKAKADGYDIFFKPQIGITRSDLIVVTHEKNFFYGMDSSSAMNELTVEKEKRVLNILGDFSIGVEMAIPKEVFINDATTYGL
jgi:hypothetical protein